ncbi:hypothetical protein SRIMM317S_00087 [Streptomyces rimosus subsp. rimosus]
MTAPFMDAPSSSGTAPAADPAPAAPGPLRRTLSVFTRNKLALTGAVVLLGLLALCYLGPLLHPTDQTHTDLSRAALPPGSPGHLLGTTDLGYDMLGRLIYGGQTSLEVGLAAGLLATLFGTVYGAVAGYFGGWADAAMMRVTDAALAIPALFLLVVVAAIVTPSKPVLILIIASVAWLSPARLIRGEALALRSRDYVHAMRLMGGGGTRAVFRHILPAPWEPSSSTPPSRSPTPSSTSPTSPSWACPSHRPPPTGAPCSPPASPTPRSATGG